MKSVSFLLIGLCLALSAQAADVGSSLWRTPDQRGDQLLSKGQPAAAATTYADPRRKAYAELQAGDYAAAAKAYSAFDDSDAHYNRGNALAASGDLQEAIKAYDAALSRNTANADARHNRDLVQKALEQQKKQQEQLKNDPSKGTQSKDDKKDSQSKDGDSKQDSSGQGQSRDGKSDGKSKPGDDKSQASKDGGSKDGASNEPSSGKDQPKDQAKDQAGAGQSAKDSQNSPPKNPSAGDQPSPASTQAQNKAATDQQASGEASAKPGQSQPAQPSGTVSGDDTKTADDKAQAQRDAESALQQSPNAPGAKADKRGQAAAADQPVSEQALAREQWLRQIPDDPGGLLRRKFLIEHLMRQQQQKGQQEQQP